MKPADRINEIVGDLVAAKTKLVNDLVDKGETASSKESLGSLLQKAGEYVPKTYILVDEQGNETTAVLVETTTIFDATDNDVRAGKTYVSATGPSVGTKVIPSYHTTEGYQLVMAGSEFVITQLTQSDKYDYTKLQVIICPYNTSIADSVAAEKIAIDEGVYAVNSTERVATVTKNSEDKTVKLGVINESEQLYLLRYFTYKEIY